MQDPVKRMKSQATDGEKIFINHISGKGLVSRIYKEISNINRQKALPLKNSQKT